MLAQERIKRYLLEEAVLWLCEPNHGAARGAAHERRQRLKLKKFPLVFCQREFILSWGRNYLDIILLLLRSFFFLRWQGRLPFCNFLQTTKKAKDDFHDVVGELAVGLLVSIALDLVLNDGVVRELGAHPHHLFEFRRAELAGGDEGVAGDGDGLLNSVNLSSKHVGVPRFRFVFQGF